MLVRLENREIKCKNDIYCLLKVLFDWKIREINKVQKRYLWPFKGFLGLENTRNNKVQKLEL